MAALVSERDREALRETMPELLCALYGVTNC